MFKIKITLYSNILKNMKFFLHLIVFIIKIFKLYKYYVSQYIKKNLYAYINIILLYIL